MSDQLDDLLARATGALRETSAQPEPRSGLTRARVLDAAERRYAKRRSPLLRWAIVLVGGLCASSALARVAQHWPEIKRAFLPDSGHEVAPPRPKPKRAAPVKAPAPAPAPVLEVPSPEAPRPIEAPPAPRVEPVRAAPRVERKPAALQPRRVEISAVAAPPSPPAAAAEPVVEAPVRAVESAELALFRRAQRLHLARDPAALAAWDDYLRVAGHGPLAPEARYNRALSLVWLGRPAAARAALEPFARGDFGGYRQRDARRLLEALSQSRGADSPAHER